MLLSAGVIAVAATAGGNRWITPALAETIAPASAPDIPAEVELRNISVADKSDKTLVIFELSSHLKQIPIETKRLTAQDKIWVGANQKVDPSLGPSLFELKMTGVVVDRDYVDMFRKYHGVRLFDSPLVKGVRLSHPGDTDVLMAYVGVIGAVKDYKAYQSGNQVFLELYK